MVSVENSYSTEHVIDISERLTTILSIFLVAAAIFMAGQLLYQFQSLPANAAHEVSITGTGKVFAKPDIATISFGAHTEAQKSQDAVNKNNAIMDAVISSIKKLGVEEKDIKTTMYSLQPMYDYGYVAGDAAVRQGAVSGSYSYPVPGKRTFRGYSLDQQIQVKIRNFDKINEILDAATSSGANTVSDLQFTVDDMESVRAEARDEAVKQAKEKAKSLFKEAGLRGTKLVSISEGYSGIPYGYGGAVAYEADKAGTPAPAPQIEAGQMEVESTVTLTYSIR